ncbi:MAG: HAD family phosphatase [Parvularcula sp.]|jgi:HAD superfamily hydrolase (TIGR01509 family)|nr:HAD family phosphatase [Parvularcula sp.]
MTIDAVLFDCDGVLVDSEIVGLHDSAAYLRGEGFTYTPQDLVRLFTGKRDDRFRQELLEAYGRVLGRPPSDDEGEALFEGLLACRRRARDSMIAVPGALETVTTVKKLGFGLAVASSSRQVFLDSKMERYSFAPVVGRHVYSAEHVAHGKPAPDIFLHAAKRLGVSPRECLVIEDSPFGVEAGLAAGMTVWGFLGGGHCFEDHGERLLAAGAHELVDDHSSLKRRLISLRRNSA